MSESTRNDPEGIEQPARTSAVSRSRKKSDDAFYRALEEEFRGSQELIRSRLQTYLTFIGPMKLLAQRPTAIDLGCGRGEWLELVREHGYEARGVDIDEGMLRACREKNLAVENKDAVEFLRTIANDSEMIVSAFHVAEHLPFPALEDLVRQAFRVLKPGGLLILETPNPENIKVSSLHFYIDPTHRHPLPPDLLSFLSKYHGFARARTIRLQERTSLLQSETVSLGDVLGGASPDYAVVAQKPCDEAVANLFDSAFEKEFGISDRALIDRFDRQLAAHIDRAAALEAALRESISQLKVQVVDAVCEQEGMRARSMLLESQLSDAERERSALRERISKAESQLARATRAFDLLKRSRLIRFGRWLLHL